MRNEKQNIYTLLEDVTWHFHPVHNYVFHLEQPAERSLHLGCRDVLSFPAESVSCSVLEVHVAVHIHNQHVTWREGRSYEYILISTTTCVCVCVCVRLTREIGTVILLEDTVSNLFAGCRLVDITIKPPKRVILNDPAYKLTGLS